MVISDSRWTHFQGDLQVLVGEGNSEPFGERFHCVALLLGTGKTGKIPSLFPQKNFNLRTCSYWGVGDGKEVLSELK